MDFRKSFNYPKANYKKLRYSLNLLETIRICLEVSYFYKRKAYNIDTKFTDMAKHAYQALKSAMDLRDDLTVVVLTHSENTGDNINPYFKIKTLGK